MIKKIYALFSITAVSLLPALAIAATQGVLNYTQSSASFNLNVQVNNEVQISGLTDININSWQPDSSGYDAEINNVCVYSNTTKNAYQITFSGQNSSTDPRYSFTLNPSGMQSDNYVKYIIFYTPPATAPDQSPPQTVINGSTYTFIGSAIPGCTDGRTVKLSLNFVPGVTNAAFAAGPYTDTITVEVQPPIS